MSKKRGCKFNDDLRSEFPFIKKTKSDYMVKCEKCNGEFSISHGGKNDISKHLETQKHKRYLNTAASSSKIQEFLRKTTYGDEEKKLALAEGLMSFHAINHNHSFRSMDCTSQVVKKLFNKKFACARTKSEAIVCNVLSPYAFSELNKNLEKINFISIYSDASNHKDIKLFPTIIRFFDSETGINIRILDFVSLPGETSEIIFSSIINILEKNNLKHKMIAYCADNTNANFGGKARRGTNNIFYKLNKNLNQNIIGVGCAAHIIHNAIQTAADLLPVDVENIVIKIYSYFYIYTVRVEMLKEFCETAEVEYQKILGYSKTRWLALLPAVERILKIYDPLKSYFLSQDKCPRILEEFFEKESSKIWLEFVHNQAALFQNAIKLIEGDKISVIEVANEVNNLKFQCQERLENNFLPLTIRNSISQLEEQGAINRADIMNHVKKFYSNCIDYLEEWTVHYNDIEHFHWVTLKQELNWNDVQKSFDHITQNFPYSNISENDLFNEVSLLKKYIDKEKVKSWASAKITIENKWLEIFHHFETNHVPYNNALKIVEYALSLPGTNAATERVFSTVNKVWTSEKSQLSVETLKAILCVKYNLTNSCEKFHDLLNNDSNLLKKIHSNEKYAKE